MPSVSGANFSKADILSAVETLAWSSLPVLADQVVQHLFFKNIPPRIDRTIAGLFTCAIIICYLPYGSPARLGAPFLFMAYRAALSFWNRKPKPTTTPKPPASAPSPQTPPTTKNPAPSAALDSSAKTPAAAKEEAAPPPTSTSKPPAARSVPTIRFTPPSPPRERPQAAEQSTSASPAKASVGSAPKEGIREKTKQLEDGKNAFMAQAQRVDQEVRKNLTSIPVKIKITDLLQKETKSELKDPEVINATFYINPHFLFKFSREMLPTLQRDMKKQYSITENTFFCWVFLSREKTVEPSRFPFEYFPIEILRPLAGKKKTTILKIETETKVFEIEFLKATCQAVGKCLKKLDKCTKYETIQPEACVIPMNPEKDTDGLTIQVQAVFMMKRCYLTPFEKK